MKLQHIFKVSTAVAVLGAALASQPAFAQDANDVADDASIVVTGSRIARPDVEASVPIAVVSQEEITQTGANNIQDVLADIPAVGQNFSRSSSNFSTTGNGVATVNLRNLGSSRTLVLVNGRRFVAGIPGTAVVDLNVIPTDLVKQIDVVTGGASAVYGSEAIAGVVNFILDDEFDGLRMRAQANVSDKGDAARQLVSLTGGTSLADDRFHIVVNGQYDRDEGLRSRNRSFSAVDVPNRSSFAAQGLFSPTGTFAQGAATFTFDSANQLKQYQGANIDGFNRNGERFLSVPVERYLGTALAKFEISDGFELFGEFNYAKSKSRSRLEPQAVANTDLTNPDGSVFAGIPITNPFVPAAIRNAAIAAGVTAIPFRRRSNDIFDRSNRNDRETWRAVAGVRGDVGRFNWEAYYAHGETKDFTASETILGPQYINALNAVAGPNGPVCSINVDANPGNNDAACVPINIFGANTVSAAAATYVTGGNSLSTYDARVTQDVAAASVAGELFSIGSASPIGVVVGAEYRKERSVEDFDEATNLGLTLGNFLSDTTGEFDVKEVFGEIAVPILEDRPFFHYLGVEAAGRYSDYSTVGGVFSWKVGGEWAPIRDIRFRGVYAEATRAPNISELFSAQSETFPAITDPCDQRAGEGDNAPIKIARSALPAACLAIPAIAAASNTAAGFVYTTAQIQTINGFLGGNPALTEETARTLTLGAVLQPRFLPGFSASVDYYHIEVDDAIGIIGQQTSLDECFTGSADPLFCNNITRNAQGIVTRIDALNLNTGSFKVEGFDTQVNYRTSLFADTGLDLTVRWNHLLTQNQTSFPGGPTQPELRQLDCYSCGRLGTGFRDKVNASATLDFGDLKLTWRTNYLSSVADDITSPDAIFTGEYWYHDAQLRFGIDDEDKFDFYLGIDNVFDKLPPMFRDTNLVTFPGTQTAATTYDTYGRMLYAGVDFRF